MEESSLNMTCRIGRPGHERRVGEEEEERKRREREDQESIWEPGECVAKSLRYMIIRRCGERSKAQPLTWRGLGKDAEGEVPEEPQVPRETCLGFLWDLVLSQ